MNPDLRLLRASDSLPELTDLLHRAYRELLEAGLRFTATGQSVETTRHRVEEGECWVAEIEGKLVGTIVWVRPSEAEDVAYYRRPDVAHFGQFGVDPEYRSLGLGRRLLDVVESRAREEGYAELALDTSENAAGLIALYERWGYRIVDSHDWRPGVNYLSVVMAKSLSG